MVIYRKLLTVCCMLSLFSGYVFCKSTENKTDNKIAIQIIGTPASGKSYAVKTLKKHMNPKIAKLLEDIRSVDLDIARESISSLSPNTQFYLIVRSLDLFRRASQSMTMPYIKSVYNELVEFVNDTFAPKFQEVMESSIHYDKKTGTLLIEKEKVEFRNIGKIVKTFPEGKLKTILDSFDTFSLGNILNRYEHLKTVMESVVFENSVQLDNVGTASQDILKCLKTLRDDHYMTLTILIHPQTAAVNLLLSALRGVQGAHFVGPDFLLKKYVTMSDISTQKYNDASEKAILLHSDSDLQKLKDMTADITIKDNNNPENAGKTIDLFVVDSRSTLENTLQTILDPVSKEQAQNARALFRVSIALLSSLIDSDKSLAKDTYTKAFQAVIQDIKKNNLFNPETLNDDIKRTKKLIKANKYISRVLKDYNIEDILSNFYKKHKQELE